MNKWAIKLRSKYTGKEVHLALTYDTRADAESAAKEKGDGGHDVIVFPVQVGPGDHGLNPWYVATGQGWGQR